MRETEPALYGLRIEDCRLNMGGFKDMPEVRDYRALIGGGSWNSYGIHGTGVILTYSFPLRPSEYFTGRQSSYSPDHPVIASFRPFDEEAKALARDALAQWAEVSGLIFHETTNHEGDITFGFYDLDLTPPPAAGMAIFPGWTMFDDSSGGDVFIDDQFEITPDKTLRSAGEISNFKHVLLHELGHALGLKHPFETKGDATDVLSSDLDNGIHTVMSYTPPRLELLGDLDIDAIQYLYGSPSSALYPLLQSWDASSETLTTILTSATPDFSGSSARDVVTVNWATSSDVRHTHIWTGDGDDVITLAGQSVTIVGGRGVDIVNTGIEFTNKMRITKRSPGDEYILGPLPNEMGSPSGPDIQIYKDLEEMVFTNGTFDAQQSVFFYNELPPISPVLLRWWVASDGMLHLAGRADGGATVVLGNGSEDIALTVANGAGNWSLSISLAAGAIDLTLMSERRGQVSASTDVATARIGGADADTLDGSGDLRVFLQGLAGDDILTLSAGDDLVTGGTGTDTAVLAPSRNQIRVALVNDTLLLRGPDGDDTLTSVEKVKFADTPALDVVELVTDPVMATSHDGIVEFVIPDRYVGPVDYLHRQFLGDIDKDVVGGTLDNDFMNLLGGDDAASGLIGNDVLDGGLGSNFLAGGSGADTFFLDGRGGGGSTWSTITDWEPGEQVALWGWLPGISISSWNAEDGAPGWSGATLRADLDGNGGIDVAVTFSAKSQAEVPAPSEFPGLLWFV